MTNKPHKPTKKEKELIKAGIKIAPISEKHPLEPTIPAENKPYKPKELST